MKMRVSSHKQMTYKSVGHEEAKLIRQVAVMTIFIFVQNQNRSMSSNLFGDGTNATEIRD